MKSNEPVTFEVEADGEGLARDKARAAGFWVGSLRRAESPPGSLPDQGIRLLSSRRPDQPRFTVKVVQHSDWREQSSLIVTIAAGIVLGVWLSMLSLWLFGAWRLAAAMSDSGPRPPALSTPAPGQNRTP